MSGYPVWISMQMRQPPSECASHPNASSKYLGWSTAMLNNRKIRTNSKYARSSDHIWHATTCVVRPHLLLRLPSSSPPYIFATSYGQPPLGSVNPPIYLVPLNRSDEGLSCVVRINDGKNFLFFNAEQWILIKLLIIIFLIYWSVCPSVYTGLTNRPSTSNKTSWDSSKKIKAAYMLHEIMIVDIGWRLYMLLVQTERNT